MSDPAPWNSDSVVPPREGQVTFSILLRGCVIILHKVIPPRACWFNMASLVQCSCHASSEIVIPPRGYSEKVVPPDTNSPCILNQQLGMTLIQARPVVLGYYLFIEGKKGPKTVLLWQEAKCSLHAVVSSFWRRSKSFTTGWQ